MWDKLLPKPKTPKSENFNVEYKGVKVKDVGEKVGSLFGEEGRQKGKKIDDATKDVDINLGN